MVKLFLHRVFLLSFVIGQPIFLLMKANAQDISSVQDAPGLVVVGEWSVKNYSSFFENKSSRDANLNLVKISNKILTGLYLPPANILSIAYFSILGRYPAEIKSKILSSCNKMEFVLERKIACLSFMISAYLRSLPTNSIGVVYDGRTFCATAAHLFVSVFNALKIPRSFAGYVEASVSFPILHVVNYFGITDEEGRTFGYVMDVGNFPGILFASSMAARDFAMLDSRGAAGRSRFPTLDFSKPGALIIKPAK